MNNRKNNIGVWILCGLVSLASTAVMRAADHPQFGAWPSRNMVSNETDLPVTFDPRTGENVKWSVELGRSYATPVVAAGRVYIGCNNQVIRDPRHRLEFPAPGQSPR